MHPQQRILRLICRAPAHGASKHLETYFNERLRESEKFLQRFASVNFVGKKVLDFGCGLGSTAFLVAKRGASRVVGIDIDSDRIAFALGKLSAQYSKLKEVVEFALPREMADEKFDIVISQDCFEHYAEPNKIMAKLRGLLTPSGYVMIGFGPLWKSPWGGHIGYMTRFPWAHLIFSESVIMAERRRYRPAEEARTFAEIRGGLNKMTYTKFLEVVASAGYEVLSLRANASRNLVMRLFALLSSVSFIKEFFTVNLYAIIRPQNAAKLADT